MRTKKLAGLLAVLLATSALYGCVGTEDMQQYAVRRCEKAASLCRDSYHSAEKTEAANAWSHPAVSQNTVDEMETVLLDAGFDVMDSSVSYPSYLKTADRFCKFWEDVQQGKASRQELISISGYGILEYRLFVYHSGEDTVYLHSMTYGLDQDVELNYEVHRVLDWELSERGNFYYQIRGVDHTHYEDYTLVRLTAPDAALQDWNLRCIQPIGYTAVNLFLTDWSESDWNALSFNDLWEYVYFIEYGEPYQPEPQSKRCQIPSEEFERLVSPYFHVDMSTFRGLAQYQRSTDSYPWRQVVPNDFHFLGFYACTPEVVGCRDNGDGTVTLTVEVLSTDLKLDCLFAHEVTIRPLENGGFQYVSNRITYRTEYGLPYGKPRLAWD